MRYGSSATAVRPAPPAGKKRWTRRLLAEQVVELKYADAVSHETVRRAGVPTVTPGGAASGEDRTSPSA